MAELLRRDNAVKAVAVRRFDSILDLGQLGLDGSSPLLVERHLRAEALAEGFTDVRQARGVNRQV